MKLIVRKLYSFSDEALNNKDSLLNYFLALTIGGV